MPERIVAGFDQSPVASAAARWAAHEAHLRHAQLDVVACYSLPAVMTPTYGAVALAVENVDAIRDACTSAVDALVNAIAVEWPDLVVERIVSMGAPADVLLEVAEGAALVVIGNSHRSELSSVLLGSVAHAVTRRSPCPVAIVRSDAPRPDHGPIVVGVDGSEHSMKALEWAVDEADRWGRELVVVHSWSPVDSSEMTTGSYDAATDIAHVDAACVLDAAVERARERAGCDVRGELRRGGLAWVELVHAARDAELLVVGTRGRGELRSLLFGSVAHALTKESPCTLVVVGASTTRSSAHEKHRTVDPGDRSSDATAVLNTSQCWALLRDSEVGRLAVTTTDGPEIFPVNFVTDHGTVVFRTTEGTKLAAVGNDERVAFEIDGGDRELGEAWSVVVKGVAQVISDVYELFEATALPLFPWNVSPKHRFVRIIPDAVTGRRFSVVERSHWHVAEAHPRAEHE